LDHLIVDLRLKDDVQAAMRKRAPQKKKRKKRKKASQIADDDNGFHFIAYIPLHGHVWKLDGTEPRPRRLGRIFIRSKVHEVNDY
jgi:ubiquitin carboxyl-terminal hydrolase L5